MCVICHFIVMFADDVEAKPKHCFSPLKKSHKLGGAEERKGRLCYNREAPLLQRGQGLNAEGLLPCYVCFKIDHSKEGLSRRNAKTWGPGTPKAQSHHPQDHSTLRCSHLQLLPTVTLTSAACWQGSRWFHWVLPLASWALVCPHSSDNSEFSGYQEIKTPVHKNWLQDHYLYVPVWTHRSDSSARVVISSVNGELALSKEKVRGWYEGKTQRQPG